LFIHKNKGFIIDYGNAVLDNNYENNYKYLIHSDKLKSNYRRIYNIQDDFYFYIRNVKSFIENVESIKDSVQFSKIKRIVKYIHNKKKDLKEHTYEKQNHAIDFYNFLIKLDEKYI